MALFAIAALAAGAYYSGKKEKEGIKGYSDRMGGLEQVAKDTQAKIDPFAQYRGEIAGRLAGIVSGREDFKTDPGYQFRLSEAMRETERAGAARGMNVSGSTYAALQQRSQNIASQEYGNIINRLSYLAGATPQAAVAGGQAYGNIMSQMVTGQAEARMAQGQASAAQIGGMTQAVVGGMGGMGGGGMMGGMGGGITPQPILGAGGTPQAAGAGTGYGGIFRTPGGFT